MDGETILTISRRAARRYSQPHENDDCASTIALALVESQDAISKARDKEAYAYRVARNAAWEWVTKERKLLEGAAPMDCNHVLAELRSRYIGPRGKPVQRKNRLSRAQVAWAYDLALISLEGVES
jgi:DNA-directed RNA polymerase specialized sigma24 family protein